MPRQFDTTLNGSISGQSPAQQRTRQAPSPWPCWLCHAVPTQQELRWEAGPSWEGAQKDQGTNKQSPLCRLHMLLVHWQCGCIFKPAGLTAGQFGGAKASSRPAVLQSSFNSSRQGHY